MSSNQAHINLRNSLMAADRMWEATVDTLTDAVYIFGPDKRLKKINRAGESLERAHRSFLASLADLAPDEIYTLDTDRRFTWMNQRAEEDSGLTRSVLLGQEFNMVVTAESKDEANAAVSCTLGGE